MKQNEGKIKIAVLGGGCGSMTAAFYLTSTPELRDKYELTVYQDGWRLGGKGASGRDRQRGDRILEHGLHMFMGFYENAFRTMRLCYAEWKKKPENPFQTWQDAFSPQRYITLQQSVKSKDGRTRWVTRTMNFPRLPGEPGDGMDPPELLVYIRSIIYYVIKLIEGSLLIKAKGQLSHASSSGNRRSFWKTVKMFFGMKAGHLAIDAAKLMLHQLDTKDKAVESEVMSGLIGLFGEIKKWLDSEEVTSMRDLEDDLLFIWELLDLGVAMGIGLLTDVLPYGNDGFNRINDYDLKEWLQKHGATKETSWSAPVRGFYELAFAYVDGDDSSSDNARISAGAASQIMLRLGLGYKDAPLWRMNASMGDTIFTPFYEVLKERGVKFKFFHRVMNLKLSEDKNLIQSIEVRRQVDLKAGADAEYHPLFSVHNLPCWPSEPDYSQIKDGEALKEKLDKNKINLESSWWQEYAGESEFLKYGEDFDQVVLGISIGAFKDICSELIAAPGKGWDEMTRTTLTVQTQALQLWLTPNLKGLGWKEPPVAMTAYANSLNSWGEMSELLPMENWPVVPGAPKSIEYFCGVLKYADKIPPYTDTSFPSSQEDRVKKDSIEWLNKNVGHIWPGAVSRENPGGLDFSLLADLGKNPGSGEERMDYQYWKVAVDPSERYVLSVPGSIKYRKYAGDSGFSNLFLAGDWVVTSINGGSAEAAVEGGMMASRAICGVPEKIAYDPELK